MHIEIDRHSDLPLYRQIFEQIRSTILNGQLPAGSRLPAVRTLSKSLHVSVPTALKAYELLREAGLSQGEIGSGSYVADPRERWAVVEYLSTLRDRGPFAQYEQVSMATGIRSLASAAADPALFHGDEFLAAMRDAADSDPWTFYYAPSEGRGDLRRQGVALLSSHGFSVQEDSVLVAPGTYASLSLIVSALAKPGDRILLEDLAFLGAPMFMKSHGLETIYVPRDDEGTPDVEAMRSLIRRHSPRFILLPHGHGSPSGLLLSEAKKQAIVEAIGNSDSVLIEAGNYARLFFEESPGTCIASRLFDTGRTVYFESLDYTFSAGLRTSFVASGGAVGKTIRTYVQSHDLGGSQVLQAGVARLLEKGELRNQLSRIVPKYRRRRDALLNALQSSMPAGVTWTRPTGGFSCIVALPRPAMGEGLYEEALEHGVCIAPGWAFRDLPEHLRYFRLAYSVASPAAITEAVKILGRLLEPRIRGARSFAR